MESMLTKRQNPGLGLLVKFLLVVSGVLFILCELSFRNSNLLYNVLQLDFLYDIYNVAQFFFFATTLAGTWLDVLDRRLSAVLLLIIIVREFNQLGYNERNLILGIAVTVVLIGYMLPIFMERRSHSPSVTPGISGSSIPSSSPSTGPTSPDLAQPADNLERAKRIEGHQAYGDLLPQALKARKKEKKQD